MKMELFGQTIGIVGLAGIVIILSALQGFALWYAAKSKQKVWFICLFIFNTAGILPAIYLLFFRKNK